MSENSEQRLDQLTPGQLPHTAVEPVPEAGTVATPAPNGTPQDVGPLNGSDAGPAQPPSWHVEAGRKGAQRIHQLIQQGKRYEQEHGLKRGRQRLRQLIEEGKLYEQEHGLGTALAPRKRRPPRMKSEQLLLSFLHTMVRLVKPSVRGHVLRLIQALEAQTKVGGESLN